MRPIPWHAVCDSCIAVLSGVYIPFMECFGLISVYCACTDTSRPAHRHTNDHIGYLCLFNKQPLHEEASSRHLRWWFHGSNAMNLNWEHRDPSPFSRGLTATSSFARWLRLSMCYVVRAELVVCIAYHASCH